MKKTTFITKIAVLRAAAAKGDWREAVRIASKFSDLGEEKKPIMKAWEAYCRPEFQTQIGNDPLDLIEKGIAAVKRRYNV